ncbi:MAG: response regulator [Chitinophagaceae bacterium]|nr:response regulator [Chitinophagaceae bacterium]
MLNSHEKEFLKSNKKMERHATLKALIIDDEYDICFLLSRILRNNNLDVEFVNSLAEGKAYLTKLKPNLLFLDNHLPDGFGIDFISYVKKEYPGIKIVMVTAHDTNDDRKRALQEGADFFIAKPFSASEIKSAIQQVYPN